MQPEIDKEISIKELGRLIAKWITFLTKKWLFIGCACFIGAILGFSYAYFESPVYISECTFVLEDGEKSNALGAYAGVAAMIGIDLNSGGGGIFQGENILQLYKSRKMIQQALLSKDVFNGKEELLVDRYIEFNHLKDRWKSTPTLSDINFNLPSSNFTLAHDSIMGKIVETINKASLQVNKPDKKLSIIKVEVKSKDELFAKSFNNKIVETVNNFYIQTKTTKSKENLTILQRQADSVRQILNSNIGGVARAVDENPNSNLAMLRLRVPSQSRQIDVQANSAIYQEIVKNLELAKVSFRKDKPLIQVIDEPILPLKKNKLGIFKGTIVFSIMLGFLAVLIKSFQYFLND